MPNPERPDPAALLALAQREAASAHRGRLKVFFGMAPGVGKTYAMLAAAQRLASQGHDVVIGLVETHGRTETEQQILGLDVLPRRAVEYRGATLQEFDLDAALQRKPEILVVDELAHTNAPGVKHAKRWEDINACLDAGINVYSTLNVQHIDSLNDVVAQITGVSVRETIPDSVIEQADEIELVDLPPDALLERLRAGKVYVPEQIAAATDSFFRKGNLTALRELALRRTAEWVDRQMQRYRQGEGLAAGHVWPAADRILVCVGPSPSSRTLLRAAKRMAAGLHADLIAVFVENPSRPISDANRERVMETMRQAESLGAEVVTLSAGRRAKDAAGELIAFARTRNVSKVVVGKTARSRLAVLLLGSFMDEIIRRSGEINVFVIQGEEETSSASNRSPRHSEPSLSASPAAWARSAAVALVGVALATGVGMLLQLQGVAAANIAMLYLLMVAAVSYRADRRAALLAAIFAVAAFDFLFVPPFKSFGVSDTQYLITFAAMLIVGLVIAGLTDRLRHAVAVAREREARAAALYAVSRELGSAREERDVAAVAAKHLHQSLEADIAVLVADETVAAEKGGVTVLATAGSPDWLDEKELPVARWTLDRAKPAGLGTQALPAARAHYAPMRSAQDQTGGAIAVHPHDGQPLSTSQLMLLESVAAQTAQALDRVHLIESRQAARLETESERLRNALLSSVSHDLRTPLAGIAGAASTLKDAGDTLDHGTRTDLIDSIVSQSHRLNDLIANLVFATRLESGNIDLRREWTTLEEIIGAGLAPHRDALAGRRFRVTGLSGLPMLRVDNAMLPQVINNLIANALRYTPDGTPITIGAWIADTSIVVKVADEGPGLAPGETDKVFQRFYRGRTARLADSGAVRGNTAPGNGMGLGLTICQGIIKAHGGRIWVEANHPRGVAFLFSLPIEYPQPSMPVEAGAKEATG